MKLQIPLWLVALAALVSLAWYLCAQDQLNARLTSDAGVVRGGMPMAPSPIFSPPSEYISIRWHTNHVPLVVREEVSSNVFRVSIWWVNGKPQTNYTLMASNLISSVTNSVP